MRGGLGVAHKDGHLLSVLGMHAPVVMKALE